MALSYETIATYGVVGLGLGTTFYLYKTGFFEDLLSPGVPVDKEPPGPAPTPAPTPTGYAYYAKRKYQCRDAHLTFAFLASQGVRIANYKVHNDGLIYPAVCNSPGPLMILVAIDVGDAQSGSILQSLGFIQYFAPATQPNPNVPIPAPPNPLPSSNYAMAYVGSAGGHRAYKSYAYDEE